LSGVTRLRLPTVAGLLALSLFVFAACGGGEGGGQGEIAVQGSSTVLPITQAAAEAFNQENPDVQITVGGGGTGDGFEAFCGGDTQIADASRPINDEEQQTCQENGVEFIELPVALDGLAVVVNPQNDFANDITVDELRTIWEPSAEGEISTWNQVRSTWPEQTLNLYGPGTQSGTFDYFTERVVGKAKESRSDYQASEDDNVLVQGVAGDPDALGYFGFGYFEENQQRLKDLPVDDIAPSVETVQSGEYPLSRPLFIYLSTQALEDNPAVQEFADFYVENSAEFAEQAQFVPLAEASAQEARERLDNRTTGTSPEEAVGGEGKAKAKEEQKK
jgi:phosphate transport system substrate-binding protein